MKLLACSACVALALALLAQCAAAQDATNSTAATAATAASTEHWRHCRHGDTWCDGRCRPASWFLFRLAHCGRVRAAVLSPQRLGRGGERQSACPLPGPAALRA